MGLIRTLFVIVLAIILGEAIAIVSFAYIDRHKDTDPNKPLVYLYGVVIGILIIVFNIMINM